MEYRKLAMRLLVHLLLLGMFSLSACTNTASIVLNKNFTGPQGVTQANVVPGWEQVNGDGFGNVKEQEVSALEAFNGSLYAGTYNIVEPLVLYDGARIFRSPDGVTWTAVTGPGFQNPHDSAPPAILDFVVFGTRLYASTGRGGNPAQIWRSSNGTSWAPMVSAGFGDPDIHDIAALAVFNNVIYAGAGSQVSGAKIYRSSTGDSNTWTLVTPAAATMAGAGVTGFEVFNTTLYATVESEAPLQIWRSSNGSTWTVAVSNGFGDSQTTSTGGMAVFGGYLYVGAGNTTAGAQLWRSNNGTSWAGAIPPGFGDPNNKTVEMVFVFQNQLYVGVQNDQTGIEIWRSADGTNWEQVNVDGFGDSKNTTTNGSHAATEFLSQLYVGTSNIVTGAELWRTLAISQTFADVPPTHPYYQDIEILYANNMTAGCQTSPLKFCPDQVMNRAQAAAFMLRGNFGPSYVPPVPTHIFKDDWTKGPWAEGWAEGMKAEGFSAGCLTNPLKYCPWDQIPREQAVIFALKLKYGKLYTPPPATGTLFADMTNPSFYATAWAEQAYMDGIIADCGISGGKPLFCPKTLVSRGLAAYMIVRAKNLAMP